jgi:hypothetical protein
MVENTLKRIIKELDGTHNKEINLTAVFYYVYITISSDMVIEIMKKCNYDFSDKKITSGSILEKLYKKAIEDNNFIILYKIHKIFNIDIQNDFGILIEDIIEKVIKNSTFRSVLYLEKILILKYDNELMAINKWWKYTNKLSIEYEGWIEFYYLSRKLELDIDNYEMILSGYESFNNKSNDFAFPIKKTNEAIERVLRSFINGKKKGFLEYLEKINLFNNFAYYADDSNKPLFKVRLQLIDINNIVRDLFLANYDIQEIVDIYMNTFIRSKLYFDKFLIQLVNLNIFEVKEYINLYKYFGKYNFIGENTNNELKIYSLKINNTNIDDTNAYNNINHSCTINDNWIKYNKKYIEDTFKVHTKVKCKLLGYNQFDHKIIMTDVICVNDTYEELIEKREETYDEIKKVFERIINQEELKSSDRLFLKNANYIFDFNEINKMSEISILIVKCCLSLSNDFKHVYDFLTAISKGGQGKLNPHKYEMSRYKNQKINEAEFYCLKNEVTAIWNELISKNLSMSHIFYIYINTVFKIVIDFNELFEINNYRLEILNNWFAGQIIFYSDEGVIVKPTVFKYKYRTKFIYEYSENTNKKSWWINSIVYFKLKEYDSINNVFYLSEVVDKNKFKSSNKEFKFAIGSTKNILNSKINNEFKNMLSADGVEINEYEMITVIKNLMMAVEYRSDNIININEYFKLLGNNNFFQFNKDFFPSYDVNMHGNKMKKQLKTILKYNEKYDRKDDFIYFFMNTYFKLYISIEDFLNLYYSSKDIDEYQNLFISFLNYKLAGEFDHIIQKCSFSNIICNNYKIINMNDLNNTNFKFYANIVGYDVFENRVDLEVTKCED